MALPAIGAAIMRGGAAISGAGGARSAAGSILKSGGQMKVSRELQGLYNIAKETKPMLASMNKHIANIANTFAKASPAFQQQLVVINKSIQLFLRPIGDILAKFVRPMAIWMIKFAQKWYDLFGTGTGEKESKESLEDKKKQLEVERESAVMEHGEGSPEVAAIDQQIAAVNASLKGTKDALDPISDAFDDSVSKWASFAMGIPVSLENLKTTSNTIWKDFIPEALVVLWESIKETGKELWNVFQELFDVLKPFLEPLWELAKIIGGAVLGAAVLVLIGAFKTLTFILKGVTTVLELVQVLFVWMDKWFRDFGSWLKDTWQVLWPKIKEGFVKLYNFAKDKFIGIWDSITNAMSGAWDKLTGLYNKVKGWFGGDDDEGDKAVGGEIPITGTYKLHAGERVLTAGQSSMLDQTKASGFNFSNTFFVTANLQNQMDIQELARLLSEYQEIELRRRVSYV